MIALFVAGCCVHASVSSRHVVGAEYGATPTTPTFFYLIFPPNMVHCRKYSAYDIMLCVVPGEQASMLWNVCVQLVGSCVLFVSMWFRKVTSVSVYKKPNESMKYPVPVLYILLCVDSSCVSWECKWHQMHCTVGQYLSSWTVLVGTWYRMIVKGFIAW